MTSRSMKKVPEILHHGSLMMEAYVEGLAREDFVPAPGFACAGCEFFNNCRKWC